MHAGIGAASTIHLDRAAKHGLERPPHLAGDGTLARLFGITGEVGTAITEFYRYRLCERKLFRQGARCLFRHANLLRR